MNSFDAILCSFKWIIMDCGVQKECLMSICVELQLKDARCCSFCDFLYHTVH